MKVECYMSSLECKAFLKSFSKKVEKIAFRESKRFYLQKQILCMPSMTDVCTD